MCNVHRVTATQSLVCGRVSPHSVSSPNIVNQALVLSAADCRVESRSLHVCPRARPLTKTYFVKVGKVILLYSQAQLKIPIPTSLWTVKGVTLFQLKQ